MIHLFIKADSNKNLNFKKYHSSNFDKIRYQKKIRSGVLWIIGHNFLIIYKSLLLGLYLSLSEQPPHPLYIEGGQEEVHQNESVDQVHDHHQRHKVPSQLELNDSISHQVHVYAKHQEHQEPDHG